MYRAQYSAICGLRLSVVLAEIGVGRRSELLAEHCGKGARAVVPEPKGDIDDLCSRRELFQSHDKPRLLPPLTFSADEARELVARLAKLIGDFLAAR